MRVHKERRRIEHADVPSRVKIVVLFSTGIPRHYIEPYRHYRINHRKQMSKTDRLICVHEDLEEECHDNAAPSNVCPESHLVRFVIVVNYRQARSECHGDGQIVNSELDRQEDGEYPQ